MMTSDLSNTNFGDFKYISAQYWYDTQAQPVPMVDVWYSVQLVG